MVVKLKEPYWMLTLKKIRKWKADAITQGNHYWTTAHFFRTWLHSNLRHFYYLTFKRCKTNEFRDHYFGLDGICLRCKQSRVEIDRRYVLSQRLKRLREKKLQQEKEKQRKNTKCLTLTINNQEYELLAEKMVISNHFDPSYRRIQLENIWFNTEESFIRFRDVIEPYMENPTPNPFTYTFFAEEEHEISGVCLIERVGNVERVQEGLYKMDRFVVQRLRREYQGRRRSDALDAAGYVWEELQNMKMNGKILNRVEVKGGFTLDTLSEDMKTIIKYNHLEDKPMSIIEVFLGQVQHKRRERAERHTNIQQLKPIDISKIFNPYLTGFEIGKHLLVRLESKYTLKETKIYVNGKFFRNCKYLLLNIDTTDKELYKKQKEIDSIDEAAELLSNELEGGSSKIYIPPETEYWGHCSNLEAWYENGYDLRLLHSNLSLPLLRKLSEVDNTAKMRFKEQITERILQTGKNAIEMFRDDLKLFNVEEIKMLFEGFLESEKVNRRAFIFEAFCDYIGYNKRKKDYVAPRGILDRIEEFEREEDDNIVRGGMDQDDNMEASGDYIATVNNMISFLVRTHGQVYTPLKIISDPQTWTYSAMENHLFTTSSETPEEFTEQNRILAMPEIGEWEVRHHNDLGLEDWHYRMIIEDAEGHQVRTGDLTLT